MCHTGQRRRIAGGQQEDTGRGSRWGGRGGGGDVCQEGWLGSTLEGTEGRKKVSQAFVIPLYPFISLCLFLSRVFTPHLDSLYPFFSPFSTLVLLPVQAPYVLSSFILFFHSFHSCLSLLCTFFPLLPLCVCFNHLLTGKELGERSVPVQSRLCHPTERVGVKHRHWHSLLRRWHHIEANGSRAT